MNTTLLQKRIKLFITLYTWKILEGKLPNCGVDIKIEGESW